MTVSSGYAQSLFSARAASMAAYNSAVKDSRAFVDNPAGLVQIRDWDFTTSTYYPLSGGEFVFQGIAFGKRLFDDAALGFQYAPGSILEFTLPSAVTLAEPGTSTSFDKKISYEEQFAFGYAQRFGEISTGVVARVLGERVTDTQYELVLQDTLTYARTSQNVSQGNTVLFDIGLQWRPVSSLLLSFVAADLVQVKGAELPLEYEGYRLQPKASFTLGASFMPMPGLLVAAQGSSQRFGSVGYEVNIGKGFTFRNGVYLDNNESPFAYAVGVGTGWQYEFLEIDAGYLRFLNRETHAGSASISSFTPASLHSIDLNQYTRDRVLLSVKAVFGNTRESLVKIEHVEMNGSIYPSSSQVFAYQPLGTVRVRNISARPVTAKATFYIDNFMDSPTETQSVYIAPGESVDVPFVAVFNDKVKSVSTLTVSDGNVSVSAVPMEEVEDKSQTRVIIHGRNDWDGDVNSLRYFVQSDDQTVVAYARDLLFGHRDSIEATPKELRPFRKAKILFDAFAGKLLYVSDPRQSSDYVQYPAETLKLRGGDCDDMTTVFSSLLGSIGISTAFVDVVPPGNPEKSHIYLLFDTGLEPRYGGSLTQNPKRFVVRRNPRGQETLWIPVETTVIAHGFAEAWTTGAQEYFDDVEVGLGLVQGWVNIVDVN